MLTSRLFYFIPILLIFGVMPAFALTNSTNSSSPYYLNPLPSTQILSGYVSTLFGKLNQATTQMAGPNAGSVQNVTNAVQTVIISGIDFFGAIKYIVAALLGLIIPKIFGVNVPPMVLPITEFILIAAIVIGIWKHAWHIFVVAIIIMIVLILVFLGGGVLIH